MDFLAISNLFHICEYVWIILNLLLDPSKGGSMPQIKNNICPERRLSFKLYSNAPICIVLQKRVFILFGSVQLPHCEDNWPKIELMAKIRGGQLWLKRRRSCPEYELFVFDLARASRVLILTTLDHQGLTTSGKIE